jgi:hypothetical protein
MTDNKGREQSPPIGGDSHGSLFDLEPLKKKGGQTTMATATEGIVSDIPMGDVEHEKKVQEFLSRINEHVKPEPTAQPSGRLRCPDCDTGHFEIFVPPEYTPSENFFSYVICAKCGKLWKIRIMNVKGINDSVQYLAKGRLEAVKP